MRQLGLEVRIGMHTGEKELVGNDIRGIAVQAAARVIRTAGQYQILVNAATRSRVEGSRMAFEPRGSHMLNGIRLLMDVHALQ